MSPQQTGKAFDELRSLVKTGMKAKPGFIDLKWKAFARKEVELQFTKFRKV